MFAQSNIEKGQLIVLYEGELVTSEEGEGGVQSSPPKMAPSSSPFPTKGTNYGMLFR